MQGKIILLKISLQQKLHTIGLALLRVRGKRRVPTPVPDMIAVEVFVNSRFSNIL